MRLARLGENGHEHPVVFDTAGRAYDLRGLTSDIGPDFLADAGIERVRHAWADGRLSPLDADPASLRYAPPVARPGKVVCIGLNFRDHAEESGAAVPAEPVVFMKASNTVVGPNDTVLVPRGSRKTDYEVEIAVIIGKTIRYPDSPESVADAIAGYAISDDVSEREFQLERGGQWDKGKSCETFNPLGPWLVTPDEVGDPGRLEMRLWVNGALRQDGNSEQMIFGVQYLLWYLGQFMVLEPGDVVNTGTPAGVAAGSADLSYLVSGDVVEIEVRDLGRQRHPIAQA